MNENYNIFPNAKTLGLYDPFSQLITLKTVTQDEFKKFKIEAGVTPETIKNYSLYAHEITHWLDHVSTLWGQKNLVLLYNALNAKATNNFDEFWRIKLYFDLCKSERHFDYYTEIYKNELIRENDLWGHSISVGSSFDKEGKIDHDKRIFFAEFFQRDRTKLARIPVTIASILEGRAIHNEFKVRFDIVNGIEDAFQRKFAENDLNDELFGIAFNPKLILYNAIFHLTASKLSILDSRKLLELIHDLSNVALNMPEVEYKKLKSIKRDEPKLSDVYEKLIQQRDYGFLYYTLAENVIKPNQKTSIEDILRSSNLSEQATFNTKVKEEMNKNLKKLIPGPFFEMGKETILKGMQIFDIKGIGNNLESTLPQLGNITTPKMLYKDDDVKMYPLHDNFDPNVALNKVNSNIKIPFHEEYFLFFEMRERCESFINACL